MLRRVWRVCEPTSSPGSCLFDVRPDHARHEDEIADADDGAVRPARDGDAGGLECLSGSHLENLFLLALVARPTGAPSRPPRRRTARGPRGGARCSGPDRRGSRASRRRAARWRAHRCTASRAGIRRDRSFRGPPPAGGRRPVRRPCSSRAGSAGRRARSRSSRSGGPRRGRRPWSRRAGRCRPPHARATAGRSIGGSGPRHPRSAPGSRFAAGRSRRSHPARSGSSNQATSCAASISPVRIAHARPWLQRPSLPPASTIRRLSAPTDSRAAATIDSSTLALTRPNGPQPILNAVNPASRRRPSDSASRAGSSIRTEAYGRTRSR